MWFNTGAISATMLTKLVETRFNNGRPMIWSYCNIGQILVRQISMDMSAFFDFRCWHYNGLILATKSYSYSIPRMDRSLTTVTTLTRPWPNVHFIQCQCACRILCPILAPSRINTALHFRCWCDLVLIILALSPLDSPLVLSLISLVYQY